MGFRCNLSRASNRQNRLAYRFVAFLWCVEQYCWLTGQKFHATVARLGESHGFSFSNRPSEMQLEAALTQLTEERGRFLKKLEVFTASRREKKKLGRTMCSKKEKEWLFQEDFITNPSK